MSILRDKHGKWHGSEYQLLRANEKIDRDAHRAQTETAENSRKTMELAKVQAKIQSTLAVIQAQEAEKQTSLLQEKLDFDKNVQFLENESTENKWAYIYRRIQPKLEQFAEIAVKSKIESKWQDKRPRKYSVWSEEGMTPKKYDEGMRYLQEKRAELKTIENGMFRSFQKQKIETLKATIAEYERRFEPPEQPIEANELISFVNDGDWVLDLGEFMTVIKLLVNDWQNNLPPRCQIDTSETNLSELCSGKIQPILNSYAERFREAPEAFLSSTDLAGIDLSPEIRSQIISVSTNQRREQLESHKKELDKKMDSSRIKLLEHSQNELQFAITQLQRTDLTEDSRKTLENMRSMWQEQVDKYKD